MDRQGERNVENTMSGNNMQNRCELKYTQELRSPPEVDCQQPESPQGGPRHLGEAFRPRTGTSARWGDQRPAVACATAPRRHDSRLRSGFGSRVRAGLLSVLALVLGLPFAGPAAAQEVVEVRSSWELVPPDLGVGDSFRLLFVTSTTRNAESSNISTYTEFVRGRAAAGHSAIQFSSSKFRVLASTVSVDARDHTGTRYTSSNKGVPIHWLDGDKVADNYEDFYDGSWDNKNGKGKNEFGNSFSDSSFIFTGSRNNGTGRPGFRIGETGNPRTTRLQDSDPLSSGSASKINPHHFFALSPVFKVTDSLTAFSVSITSTPANATPGYAAGETIRVRVGFGDVVSVTGTPYLVLDIAGAAGRATYASGSGTNYLNFEYTVQTGDFDSNGISLCSSRVVDPGCGRISLNGGRISAQSDGLAAELDLPALGNQSDHKVDAYA